MIINLKIYTILRSAHREVHFKQQKFEIKLFAFLRFVDFSCCAFETARSRNVTSAQNCLESSLIQSQQNDLEAIRNAHKQIITHIIIDFYSTFSQSPYDFIRWRYYFCTFILILLFV